MPGPGMPRSPARCLVVRYCVVVISLVYQGAYAQVEDAYAQGREVFLDRELGHCVLCHQVTQLNVPFQGNLGPDLSGVALRMTLKQMRAKIVDPAADNPHTVMPAYHRTRGLKQVALAYRDQPILTEQQLTDLLAFLNTLRLGSTD